ncbi:MAG: 6-phosphogluconolactonase [Gallionella sp.]|nr:6-phosphogluconolactonase [Gallionella sp.]
MPSSSNAEIFRWHRYSTISELEAAAVQAIQQAAQQAISHRGQFHIVLAGGTTPRRIYQAMRSADADWSAWHIYFGDERCLPVDHTERNSRMAALTWLDHVAIPRGQIHPIPAEKGPEAAAADYTRTLSGIEQFDLVLLGLGEDGHTASLFPGQDPGNTPDAPAALAVHDAPKPPAERVSLSANRLGAARKVIFLVTGESKRQAVTDWRNGENIPAAAITPAGGADIYLEAGLLGGSEP